MSSKTFIRAAGLCAALAIAPAALLSACAHKSIVGGGSCPVAPLPTPLRYAHVHQIPTEPDPWDFSHRVITPGGMILVSPKMVETTDVLSIVARDRSATCFTLIIFGKNHYRCEITGVARPESDDAYVFISGTVTLRFRLRGTDEVQVEPVGDRNRNRCGWLGEIEPSAFTRQKGAR